MANDRRVRESAVRSSLTLRQQQVLERLLLGETSKEIANSLGLSPRTADFHVANILKRTGCSSRIRLLAMFGRVSTDMKPGALVARR